MTPPFEYAIAALALGTAIAVVVAVAGQRLVLSRSRFAAWCAERAERKQGVIASARQKVIASAEKEST